jgi:hypothetical protein
MRLDKNLNILANSKQTSGCYLGAQVGSFSKTSLKQKNLASVPLRCHYSLNSRDRDE